MTGDFFGVGLTVRKNGLAHTSFILLPLVEPYHDCVMMKMHISHYLPESWQRL